MLLLASTSGGRPSGVRGYVKRVMMTGGAIVIPIVLTIYITMILFNFLAQFLVPGVILVHDSLGFDQVPVGIVQFLTALVFVGIVFVIGVVAESRYPGGHLEQRFENAMAAIPGVGSIYSNINEVSELLLEQDTESFQEVKLVEFPHDESYMIGFVTADEPTVMEDATGHEEMTTLFAPMGPNPFMGGFVLHVPEERLHEVEMTVEEGIQAIVSSGVVVNDPEALAEEGETA